MKPPSPNSFFRFVRLVKSFRSNRRVSFFLAALAGVAVVTSVFFYVHALAATAVPMASTTVYSENFSDIANWTDNFASGIGANRWGSVGINVTGTIPDGVRTTVSTATFQTSTTSSGVQRAGVGSNPAGTITLLGTGTTDNTTALAIDFFLDFTGVNAGSLSFDWASVNNSTGNCAGSLRIYSSTDGTTFTELPSAAVLNFVNNVPTSGSIINVALPASFNNSSTARLRFYYHNGSGGTTGSRPKISFDNVRVTVADSSLKFRSAASGNWNANATWEMSADGVNWIPATQTPTSANDTITIRDPHTVTVSANVTADQLTVDLNGTLSVNNGVTFNIADTSISNDATVNGLFQTAGGVSGANNVLIGNGGTLRFNTGGFVSGRPIFATNSTLHYNTGGTYGRAGEWLPGAFSATPFHVQLSNNTTLDLPNGSPGSQFTMAGDLTIDPGSTMLMAGPTPMTKALTVGGNVNNSGTLTLSSASGGDLRLGGNLTNTGTYTHNGRTLEFTGANLQFWTSTVADFGEVEISGAVGVTLNSPINVQTLRLIEGHVTTTTLNLLTVTNTAPTAIFGASDLSYVKGPLARVLPAGLVGGTSYPWPVGKGTFNPFELVDPTTTGGGTVTVQAEVFDGNSGGTPGTGLTALNTDRYWQAAITANPGNFINTTVRLTDSSVTANNRIGKSATVNGTYDSIGGTVAFPTITSNTITTFSFFNIGTAAQEISVAVSPAAVNEDDGADLVYTFTRTNTTGSLVVDFSVSGTADSATDYTQTGATTFTPPTGSVTFADGSATAVVNITPTADTDFEADETMILTVTSGTGYNVGTPAAATGTITNDDAPSFEVNTTDDTDDGLCDATHCSLREAINAANADPDANSITFNIPTSDPGHVYYRENGPGLDAGNVFSTTAADDSLITDIDSVWPHSWWRIAPSSALPDITEPVLLDGYSQRPCSDPNPSPCSQENTLVTGDDAILLIEIDGSLIDVQTLPARPNAKRDHKSTRAVGDGLVVTNFTTNTSIAGLAINRFPGNGILILNSFGNVIRGNFLGTDISGTLAANKSLGNSVGLRIEESFGNQVGCEVPEERNIISGNVNDGVQIIGENAVFNAIQGNLIGPGRDGSVIGNGGSGIQIFDGFANVIGAFPQLNFNAALTAKFKKAGACAGCCRSNSGSAAKATQVASDPGNVIAGNGGDGVAVDSVDFPAELNVISQNSIFDNGGLGIDLGTEGITPNDNCDVDGGPNQLQNFPVVTSAFTNGPTTTIQFTLDSAVDETFTIEFYTNTSADPSGSGEGKTFIDSTTVTVSELDCAEDFSFQTGALPTGLWVTATATDSQGNTSEFGPNRQVTSPTAANSTISGTIVDDQGAGVAGVVINLSGTQNRKTITNAKGGYFFDAVETTGFYTVTPARANYSFSPGLRSFNQLGNHTDAGFNASRGAESTNPLDTAEFFVRQQYVDILGREPDEGGFNYWSNEINRCGSDAGCVNARRRDIAAAFFIEQEFQQSGAYIYNLYSGGLGRKPVYAEYAMDRRQVVGGSNLDTEKAAFALGFVQRADFVSKYQTSVTADSFVDALLQTVRQSSGVDLSGQRASLVGAYGNGDSTVKSRSLVLQWVADNAAFRQAEYNAAFVLTEYFGYLKRDPEQGGYDFWLNVLNNREPGDFRGMVCSFITSTEYQKRFSSVVTHSNAECGR